MTQKSKKSTNGTEETQDTKGKAVKKKYEEENFVDTSKAVGTIRYLLMMT